MIPLTLNQVQSLNAKDFFLLGARWSFGFWLLFTGLFKWIGGAGNFISFIESSFSETFLPVQLITAAAWLIVVLEPICGLWLITGLKQRFAWLAAAKLIFLLIIGKTLLHDYETVANNWQYLILCIACGSLCEK